MILYDISRSHCEPIVSLQFYPFQTQQADNKDAGGQGEAKPKTRTQQGRYLSISRDGILNYWSERFKLTRTVNVSVCVHACVSVRTMSMFHLSAPSIDKPHEERPHCQPKDLGE